MQRTSIFFLLSILFLACNKEEAPIDPENKQKTCKVTTAESNFNNGYILGSAKVFYDQNNNIAKVESNQDTSFMSFSVVYASDKIVLKTKYQGDWTYVLDDKKRVVKASLYTRLVPSGTQNFEFTYNSSGSLSRAVVNDSYSGPIAYTFNYLDGNLSNVTGVNSYYNTEISISYKYDLTKKATELNSHLDPLFEIGLHQVLPGFFGKTSENRLMEVNKLSTNMTYKFGDRELKTYEYASNADGNITDVNINTIRSGFSAGVAEYINSRSKQNYTFGYQCD
ncbi:hypothetical protein [Pedobacter rhizosphaerae]|uniref:YD repeat-containing protein n=1 Tax=Pedobacter rhizosphaerae TaxID=390241 RepID=A0A1H9V6I0_9SPHI|nr:hypothetical protein [Pedobacter rhizosphaerae]SES17460.1 hypothetical protein SAMN04488023_13833 [Pedobacter rhizosphaerae]